MIREELLTILIAASPFFELRGSIPVALTIWNFSPLKSYFLSVIGNFLPVIPLLFFWRYAAGRLSRHSYFLNRFFAWLFEKTQKRHANHFAYWKELALLVFVAIPLPFTGAWSGTIAAFVFGIPTKRAAPMIGLGIMIAGILVLALTSTAQALEIMSRLREFVRLFL